MNKEIVEGEEAQESKGFFILGSLSLGHVGVHWFQQLWPVIIPSVKSSLGLSNV